MDDLEKLKHLLEHWAEHNKDHAKTYLDWSEKADASGKKELARILKEIADETERLEGLFIRARSLLL